MRVQIPKTSHSPEHDGGARSGQTLVEYGLILLVMVIALIVGMSMIGDTTSASITDTATNVLEAPG